jgi:putative flippase GtrA
MHLTSDARRTLGQFTRYLVTGGAAFVVDAGGFAVLNALGAPVLPAAAASFSAAAAVNYWLTSGFVFGGGRRSPGQALGFLAVALVGLAINSGLTAVFHAYGGLPAPLAKVAAIAVTLLWNFSANKRLVFRPAAA